MSIQRSALTILAAAFIAVSATGPAYGAGGDDDDDRSSGVRSSRVDPDYTTAVSKIRAGDYESAIALLQSVAAADPENADAFNYLGYANRKLQRYVIAQEHYQRALSLEPKHRGAHEYIGELYLEIGDLERAEEHLAALDRICFFGCEEYDELKELVEAYKSGRTAEQTMNSGWRK